MTKEFIIAAIIIFALFSLGDDIRRTNRILERIEIKLVNIQNKV